MAVGCTEEVIDIVLIQDQFFSSELHTKNVFVTDARCEISCAKSRAARKRMKTGGPPPLQPAAGCVTTKLCFQSGTLLVTGMLSTGLTGLEGPLRVWSFSSGPQAHIINVGCGLSGGEGSITWLLLSRCQYLWPHSECRCWGPPWTSAPRGSWGY